jgi:nicotinate-nucleotide adenylyltransferase
VRERIGILGGTFDPPHLGHLILAQSAVEVLDLQRVLFVPVADPPHKQGQPITPVIHRVAMLQAAIADQPIFEFSGVDLNRPGPHFTVDTVRILAAQMPEATLYFLMGGDSLHDLPTWHDPTGIISQVQLGVVHRPEQTFDLDTLARQIPGIAERVALIESPEIGISATDLRARVCNGRSLRYLTPDSVIAYIQAHNLYSN